MKRYNVIIERIQQMGVVNVHYFCIYLNENWIPNIQTHWSSTLNIHICAINKLWKKNVTKISLIIHNYSIFSMNSIFLVWILHITWRNSWKYKVPWGSKIFHCSIQHRFVLFSWFSSWCLKKLLNDTHQITWV